MESKVQKYAHNIFACAPPDRQSVARTAEYERVRDLHVENLKPRKTLFAMLGSEHEPDYNGLFGVRRKAADGSEDRMDLLLLRFGNDVNGGYSNGRVDGFIKARSVMGLCTSRGVRVVPTGRVLRKRRARRFEGLGDGRIGARRRRVERCARKERDDGALKAGLIL